MKKMIFVVLALFCSVSFADVSKNNLVDFDSIALNTVLSGRDINQARVIVDQGKKYLF